MNNEVAPQAAQNVTGPVTWLRLDFDRLPNTETLEYSVKKTFFAVHAVFRLEKTADRVNVEAKLHLKIPIKGDLTFEGTSVSHLGEDPVTFSIYKEWQDDKAARVWLSRNGRLENVREGESEPRKSFEVGDSAPVLNALTLLSVFSSWKPEAGRQYAAQFAVADKIFALRFVVHGRNFSVFAKDVPGPLTDPEWRAIEWPAASTLEGTWDEERHAVGSLKVRVPVLGLVELPLSKASRS